MTDHCQVFWGYCETWTLDWTGLDWTGLDWTGLDWTGLDWTGLDWTGLDWTGLDWTGLDWTGLDWTGLDWTGLDWTGLHNSRAEHRDNRTRKYLLKLHYLKITTMHKSNINFKFHRCTYMYYLSLTTKQLSERCSSNDVHEQCRG